MKITITTVPHQDQRYDTVGDWIIHSTDPLEVEILVSELGDWHLESLVAIHELVESLLCYDRDISQAIVDQFDISHPELDEPGSNPDAPYKKEHFAAEIIERQLSSELGVDWNIYSDVLDTLE